MYHLPLRQAIGFIRDLLDQLGLQTCPVPDYTTFFVWSSENPT